MEKRIVISYIKTAVFFHYASIKFWGFENYFKEIPFKDREFVGRISKGISCKYWVNSMKSASFGIRSLKFSSISYDIDNQFKNMFVSVYKAKKFSDDFLKIESSFDFINNEFNLLFQEGELLKDKYNRYFFPLNSSQNFLDGSITSSLGIVEDLSPLDANR